MIFVRHTLSLLLAVALVVLVGHLIPSRVKAEPPQLLKEISRVTTVEKEAPEVPELHPDTLMEAFGATRKKSLWKLPRGIPMPEYLLEGLRTVIADQHTVTMRTFLQAGLLVEMV